MNETLLEKERILFIDDEESLCEFFDILLTSEGYHIKTTNKSIDALKIIEEEDFDLVIVDICMPEVDGFAILENVKKIKPDTIVIMITAYASTESAVKAMREGAYDYIIKPFKVDEVKLIIKKALERVHLKKENIKLKRELQSKYSFSNIVGQSLEMRNIFDLIRRIASSKMNVLITGESGTGKELVARAIHNISFGENAPFVAVNCGAIPENLIETELFGHVRGAFTGAIAQKKGLLEAARGGTIFFDEVGELPLALQVKLLRTIQDRTVRMVGGTEDIKVEVRVLSATNKNLKEQVEKGQFREDLFYRLKVMEINIPPLCERKSDIPVLINYFIDKYNKIYNKGIFKVSDEVLGTLLNYNYTGNIRELENIMERSIALEKDNIIQLSSIPEEVKDFGKGQVKRNGIVVTEKGINLEDELSVMEKEMLVQALKVVNGSKIKAAKLLNISFRSLRYRLLKHDLNGA